MVNMNKAAEIFISSLGLKITGAEVEQAWENSKNALPQLAQTFADMKTQQNEMCGEIAVLRREQSVLMEKLSLLVALALTPATEGSKRVEPVVPDCQFWNVVGIYGESIPSNEPSSQHPTRGMSGTEVVLNGVAQHDS
jgi:hypothetical protein